MSDWKECRIGNVVSLQQGLCINSKTKHLLVDEGYPLLRITDLINDTEVQFINRHKVQEKFLVAESSLIYTRTGQVGLVFKGKKGIVHNNCFTIKPSNEIEINYLYWFLKSSFAYDYVNSVASGAAQPDLGHSPFKSMYIRYPEKDVQRKIAAILSSYDDLIENNKRRISLLENMAEEIYREWFVRFRFPGYQAAEFVKGIPKGWPVVELKEIATESSKHTKPGSHLEKRNYLPLDIMGSKQFLPLDHYSYTAAQSSLVTFEKDEFIFGAMRPYQHKVVIAPFQGITRTTCFVIKPVEEHFYSYLYLTLFKQSTIDYAMLISNGSDRPYTVWNKGMERMSVIQPDDATLTAFEDKVRPIINLVLSYYFLQRKLTETRDLLLPRLISGKLSVEDLDIQYPPSMQEENAA